MQLDYNLFFSSLLGEAIGDALGAPIEGFKKVRLYPILRTLTMPYTYSDMQRICFNFKGFYRAIPGLHTDDTQYMLVLLDSISQDDHGNYIYDLSKSLNLFKELMSVHIPNSRSGALRGTGRNARTSFSRILRNKPLQELGTDSAGIGSAMRIGPPALLFMDKKERLSDFVIKSSIITHLNAAGISAGFAQALLTIECYKFHEEIIQNRSIKKEQVIDTAFKITNEVSNFEKNLSKKLEKIFPKIQFDLNVSSKYLHLVSESLEYTVSLIKSGKNQVESINKILKKYNARSPSGYAPVGMSVAFYQVLSKINDPIESLCSTFTLGGDTDTIGAMVGTAIFAAHGEKSIPRIWKDNLIAYDELRKRAERLIKKIDSSPTELVQLETKWTKMALKT